MKKTCPSLLVRLKKKKKSMSEVKWNIEIVGSTHITNQKNKTKQKSNLYMYVIINYTENKSVQTKAI